MVKTKYRLRSKVWWPLMDKDVENLFKVCHGPHITSICDPPDPMSRVLPPSSPWQDCSADLLGPLERVFRWWLIITADFWKLLF